MIYFYNNSTQPKYGSSCCQPASFGSWLFSKGTLLERQLPGLVSTLWPCWVCCCSWWASVCWKRQHHHTKACILCVSELSICCTSDITTMFSASKPLQHVSKWSCWELLFRLEHNLISSDLWCRAHCTFCWKTWRCIWSAVTKVDNQVTVATGTGVPSSCTSLLFSPLLLLPCWIWIGSTIVLTDLQ